jgi:hypothetical protein
MKKDAHVVGVLDEDVFAFGLLEEEISDSSDDTPTVGERDVHLSSKVFGLVVLNTDNDVVGVVLGCGSGDVSIDQHIPFT